MATCPGPTATNFFEGTSTRMSPKDMDSLESIVRKTLKAFDQKRAVPYPGQISVRITSLLPTLFLRALIARIAGMQPPKWVWMTDESNRSKISFAYVR
jgi:short-subunit dehydrogenase